MTFLPGKSGNEGGRPKELGLVKRLAREQTEAAIKKLADLMEGAEGESVQLAAAEALLNRAWGKPEQAVEVTGDLQHVISVTISKKEKPKE